MSEKWSERNNMTALAEASRLLKEIAGPGEPGERLKSTWSRAYRALTGSKWTFNRVKDLWRQERRAVVSGDELMELQRVAAARKRKEASANATDELRREIEEIRAVLERIAPEAFRNELGSLRRSADRMG